MTRFYKTMCQLFFIMGFAAALSLFTGVRVSAGSINLDGVLTGSGVNTTNKTVYQQSMILVYMNDINSKYGGTTFSTLYSQNKVDVGFDVDGTKVSPPSYNDNDGNGLYFAISLYYYDTGKKIRFETWSEEGDSTYDNTTSDYTIIAGSPSVTYNTALTKPSLSVTKISAKKAGLRWSASDNATGYRIYCNGKLIKTTGKSVLSYIYTKKGAGKAKYKVVPLGKKNGKTYAGPASAVKKGKANQRTYSVNKSMTSVKYSRAPFRIRKIVVSGKKYKVTGYVVNNRVYKMLRYQKLNVKIYCNGKVVAKKTFKKMKKAACKGYGVKKVTFTIKGKAGVDLRNATGTTWHTTATPYWKYVGTSTLN